MFATSLYACVSVLVNTHVPLQDSLRSRPYEVEFDGGTIHQCAPHNLSTCTQSPLDMHACRHTALNHTDAAKAFQLLMFHAFMRVLICHIRFHQFISILYMFVQLFQSSHDREVYHHSEASRRRGSQRRGKRPNSESYKRLRARAEGFLCGLSTDV